MLTFRPLQWADAGPLYVWRHDPITVKWSLNPPPTWDEHLRWANGVISHTQETPLVFIGLLFNNIPIVCISKNGDKSINIMTNPHFREKGFATEAIKYMQKYVTEKKLYAVIKKDNEASLRLFAKCGFKYSNYGEDTLTMEWNP